MAKKFFHPEKCAAQARIGPVALPILALFSAVLLSGFLAIAAYGKFFYPAAKLQELEKIVSVLEVGLIICLCVFRMRSWMWLLAAVIFAGWGGYALYWCCLKLPCSCAGSMISLPSQYALCMDILFFMISDAMAFFLGARLSILCSILLGSFLSALMGYAFAEWVFYVKIVGVNWRLF